jgi:hypothetical protein
MCVLYGSRKKRLFRYTALICWFLWTRRSVYCAVRAGFLNTVDLDLVFSGAVPWLTHLFAGLSPQRSRLVVFRFSPISVIPPVLHTNFIDMLLLPEGQTGEAREPSKKKRCFGHRGAFSGRVLSFRFWRVSEQRQKYVLTMHSIYAVRRDADGIAGWNQLFDAETAPRCDVRTRGKLKAGALSFCSAGFKTVVALQFKCRS